MKVKLDRLGHKIEVITGALNRIVRESALLFVREYAVLGHQQLSQRERCK